MRTWKWGVEPLQNVDVLYLWQLFQSKWAYLPKKAAQKKVTLSSYILVSVLEEILQMETDFSTVHGR